MPSKAPLTVMSDNPEVMALQAMLKGLHHITAKALEPRHFKILIAVATCAKQFKIEPTKVQIASYAGLEEGSFDAELELLVERRYIHEVHSLWGDLKFTYKLGSMGGTALKNILASKGKKAA